LEIDDMPRYEDQAQIIAARRAEQQKKALNFQQQAQLRRQQAEQQARLQEQAYKQAQAARVKQSQAKAASDAKARATAVAKQEAAQRRADAQRTAQLKRQQYTVKKGQGPAEIAKATGTTPQAIAGLGVTKFVAGQVLDIVSPRREQPPAPAVDPATGYSQLEGGLTSSLADVQDFQDRPPRVGDAGLGDITFFSDVWDMARGGGRDIAVMEDKLAGESAAVQAAADFARGGALEDSWQRTEQVVNPNDPRVASLSALSKRN
jgi:hypothetical protein